jgi:hypothetical protein
MRRRLLWLLIAPLAVTASQGAHWLAFRLAAPDAAARHHLLDETGHAYLAYAPVLAGVAAALVRAALGVRAAAAARGGSGGDGPTGGGPTGGNVRAAIARWPFALVPLVTFAAQEHVERLLQDGAIPLHAYAERTFLLGLALQLPFGVAAYLLARLLLAAADTVGRLLGALPVSPHSSAPQPAHRPPPTAPRRPALSLNLAGRGPPLPAIG